MDHKVFSASIRCDDYAEMLVFDRCIWKDSDEFIQFSIFISFLNIRTPSVCRSITSPRTYSTSSVRRFICCITELNLRRLPWISDIIYVIRILLSHLELWLHPRDGAINTIWTCCRPAWWDSLRQHTHSTNQCSGI